jgi:hypothetical protein
MQPNIIRTISEEEFKMRSIAFVLAMFFATAPAAAQEWREYTYPDYAFAVVFPGAPQVETATYRIVDNRSVPARVYSVNQENVVFKIMVAELAGTNLEESVVIDHAIKTLSEGGTVKINIPHRIYRVYGRQLAVEGADGSYSMAALFDYKDRLYQIEAKARPGRSASSSNFDLVRFQQSLTFTDGGSNRSTDAIRAIRERCRGLNNVLNAAGNPVNPAGPDDPRCRVAAPQ